MADRRNEKRELRKYRQVNGLCQTCGKIREQLNKSACDFCLERVRQYTKTDIGREKHKINRSKRVKSAYGIWRRVRDQAKFRDLDFNLEKSDIVIPVNCPLLGIPLDFYGDRYNSPSLDRIDNNKGYIKGNVWVISDLANRMKQNASIELLKTFAKNILIHFPEE